MSFWAHKANLRPRGDYFGAGRFTAIGYITEGLGQATDKPDCTYFLALIQSHYHCV